MYATEELRSDRAFVLEMLALKPGAMQGASPDAMAMKGGGRREDGKRIIKV